MAPAGLAAALLALPAALAIRQTGVPEMLNSDAVKDETAGSSLAEASASMLGPFYTVDMLRLKAKGYSGTFCGLSSDGCQTLTGFPGPNTYNYLTWGKAVEELQKVPELQDKGKIFRGNELGYLILNEGLWARDFKTLGLGSTVAQHKFFRPVVDAYLGSAGEGEFWSETTIDAHLAEFLQGKSTLNTDSGIFYWTTRLMHKLHVNIDLSPADTRKFMALQSGSLVKMVLPVALGFSDLQDSRDYFLKMYMDAIKSDTRKVFPTGISQEDLKFMASSLMDSMLFAGGLSVGNLIKTGLAVLYADPSPWKAADRQINDRNVDQFVYEVIRRYPAVVGFPWYPLPEKETRMIVNVAMALRDPRVWAESGPVLDFVLRPLATYQNLTRVAWAEPANGPEAWKVNDPGRTGHMLPMSRGCPGQALSFTIIKAFFKRWAQHQSEWNVVQAPSGGLTFSDATPFVDAMTLAKRVMAGPITLVSKSWLGSYSGMKGWAVVTAGDDEQPPTLLVFDHKNYDKDDPEKAIGSVALAKASDIVESENWLQKTDPDAKCFLISAPQVRLCADSGEARAAWKTALTTAKNQ